MPKSKRNRIVALTKTKKKASGSKDSMIADLRKHCARSSRVYLVRLENERATFLHELRARLRPGILMFGKNKVMQVALGMTANAECQRGMHKLAAMVMGSCALLFTDQELAQVQTTLSALRPIDFARSGAVATETVVLPRGPDTLAHLPHSIEAHLRALGLPTQLVEGRIHLLGDHTVCTRDQPLTTDAAQVLKILDLKQARFSAAVDAYWTKKSGQFVVCTASGS